MIERELVKHLLTIVEDLMVHLCYTLPVLSEEEFWVAEQSFWVIGVEVHSRVEVILPILSF